MGNLMLRSKDKWSQESLGSAVVVAAPGTAVVVVGACAEVACAEVTVARAAVSGATSATAAVIAAATGACAATWASGLSLRTQLRMRSKPLLRTTRFSPRRRNVRL